jgi:hypothetical protein
MYHCTENLARYYHNCTFSHVYYPLFCQILIKLEISRQIFEIFFNIKILKIASSVSRDLHVDRQTDAQKDTQRLIVTFRICLKMNEKVKH